MRWLGLLVGYVVLAVGSWAQPLHFEHLTVDHGLAGNWVRSVVQDHQGYLWIGTNNGLSRYDGYEITSFQFDLRDPVSLSDNSVSKLLIDSEGDLWIATANGLNRFDRTTESFARFLHRANDPHSLSDNGVTTLFEDADGVLWVGTASGLNRFDRTTGRVEVVVPDLDDASPPGPLAITAILEDSRGRFWVGTHGGGLVALDRASGTATAFRHDPADPTSLSSDVVSALHETREGALWVGTLPHADGDGSVPPGEEFRTGGLSRLDSSEGSFHVYRATSDTEGLFWNYISDILEDRDGTLWITARLGGASAGVFRMRPDGTFEQSSYDPANPHSLTWNYATALFEDRTGILWVGTSRGLNKLDRGRQRLGRYKSDATDPYSLLDNFYALHEDSRGLLWLGLDGPGLLRVDPSTGEVRHLGPNTDEFRGNGVYGIAEDASGVVWIATRTDGLKAFDHRTDRFESFIHNPSNPNGLSANYLTSLFLDRSGQLWIGTVAGLDVLDVSTRRIVGRYQHIPGDANSLSGNQVSAIREDSQGFVWVGTNIPQYFGRAGAAGLNRLDPRTGTVTRYRYDPEAANSLSNNGVTVIHEDGAGNIWVGTANGLNRIDPESGTVTYFFERDGLPNATVAGILEDDDGRLWLSTHGGLARLDPASGSFRQFDHRDGIQHTRFNVGSFFRSARGEMFFGGVSGYNHFFPHHITDDDAQPPVVLTSFRSRNDLTRLGQVVGELGEVVLPYRDNGFAFEFAALSFRAPERIKYAYRLEGLDRDWTYAGSRRFASYTNLKPGSYTLRVRASNGDDGWHAEEASLRVVVRPPWWLTWWAYTFYGLALAGSVVGVDRVQRRRVLLKERERARERELEQAREIERAYEELKRTQAQLVQQEKLASLGALTAGIAHEIKNPLNFINNFSQLTTELSDELQQDLSAFPEIIAQVGDVLQDLRTNAGKIAEHGRRADGIVRSMLEHSRGGKGERLRMEINALVEEYVNLAYHGKRAQDGEVDVRVERDLDPEAGELEVLPQDLGRVILNLVGNAWDAAAERAGAGDAGYRPMVRVSTAQVNRAVEIRVADNGPGIPDELRARIFEPFFTTKPAGSGTGLGLSLSHEIVTQGHGGSLTVESEPGEGSEFVVRLPVDRSAEFIRGEDDDA